MIRIKFETCFCGGWGDGELKAQHQFGPVIKANGSLEALRIKTVLKVGEMKRDAL